MRMFTPYAPASIRHGSKPICDRCTTDEICDTTVTQEEFTLTCPVRRLSVPSILLENIDVRSQGHLLNGRAVTWVSAMQCCFCRNAKNRVF